MQSQMKQLNATAPVSSSGDTYAVHVSQPPDRYFVRFNNKSPLMPANEYQRSVLSQPPFGVSLYLRRPPPLPGCGNVPAQADIEFAWDEAATAERIPDNSNNDPRWKGVTTFFNSNENYLQQTAEGIFRIYSNHAQVVSISEASHSYLRLFSRTQHKIEFVSLTIIIGQHPFELKPEQLASDECGIIIFHIPKISTISRSARD